jgi:hypothetical protein
VTLIAISCEGDTAKFVTDSLAYKVNLGDIRRTTKSAPIHHLDAAVLTRGDHQFGAMAKSDLLGLSTAVETFDVLLRQAPGLLQELHQLTTTSMGNRYLLTSPPVVYLLGWSPTHSEFQAHYFAPEDDYEATRITGTHVFPATMNERPSKVELDRLRANADEHLAPIWDEWWAQPERPEPASRDEWSDLAIEVRNSRTLRRDDLFKVLVGGGLYYTEMQRGLIATSHLLEFDDTGDELLRMVGYHQHPAAQARPCWCDSGKTYLECHLAESYADGRPCDCGSGDPFDDCCRAGQSDGLSTPPSVS